jgi:hypothetical protein
MRSVSATSLPVSKPASNWSEVVKREGRRKRSSAQSSWRLFWSGVPVMSSRKFARTRERPMCSLEALVGRGGGEGGGEGGGGHQAAGEGLRPTLCLVLEVGKKCPGSV